MKKQVLLTALLASVYSVQSQDVMVVEMYDNTVHKFKVEDVRQVTFEQSSEEPECPVAEAVDLGLPSGTKWASWNVGATKPEDYGGYYSWGETEEKEVYDWTNYQFSDGAYYHQSYYEHIGDDIDGTEYDVATVKWGGSWRMPSVDQYNELRNNCTMTWTQQNEVNGLLITGPNGASIFMPAGGVKWDYLGHEGESGNYWTSTLHSVSDETTTYIHQAYIFQFTSSGFVRADYPILRNYGATVRAVICPEQESQECPVAEAIDLGLPSGTKWASWNIGATKPEEFGGYYAWGETETKDVYNHDTYIYASRIDEDGDGQYEGGYVIQDIGTNIAGTQYDVAHVKWGDSWRMPSYYQFDELMKHCTWTWTTKNGVEGHLVTGPNGKAIFLPAAGQLYNDGYIMSPGTYGFYWSSTFYPTWGIGNAYILEIISSYPSFCGGSAVLGQSVRAVCL